uniref:Gag-Pol polyprotein n=1 Tax=Bactrocera latifrons TaxID=174628 RepID=A0A0K8UBW7_BACLA
MSANAPIISITIASYVNHFIYCLTIIERFTRWPFAVPLKDMPADVVCTAFYSNWITQFGTLLTTDQGTQFESALFTALIGLIGAHLIRITPFHPQSNELVERWHRTLKAALICNSISPWPEVLPTVHLGLRTYYKVDLNWLRFTCSRRIFGFRGFATGAY